MEEAAITRLLKTRRLGRQLIVMDECGSTNDVLIDMAERGAVDGLVVIARTQTAGKGRLGHIWRSPRGGVWMSILLRSLEVNYVNCLPLVAALAVAKTILDVFDVKAQVRWPNDVVVQGRKLAGMLVDSRSSGNEFEYAILGIGVNANFRSQDIESIAQIATTLSDLLGHSIGLELVISTLLLEVEKLVEKLNASRADELLGLMNTLDYSRGRRVKVRTSCRTVEGFVEGYPTLTRMEVRTEHGTVFVENDSLLSVDY